MPEYGALRGYDSNFSAGLDCLSSSRDHVSVAVGRAPVDDYVRWRRGRVATLGFSVAALAAGLILGACGDASSSSRDAETETARTAFIDGCEDNGEAFADIGGISGDPSQYADYCTAMLDCVEEHLGSAGFARFLSENPSVSSAGAAAVNGNDAELRRCIVGF